MSATTITPDTPVESTRSRVLPALIGGGSGLAVLAALAIAFWPASEADKAYDDGQAFGSAVTQLQSAETSAEVDDALTAMNTAVADTREHAGDAVADQVDAQADALARAADGVAGMVSADDEFTADVYEYELDVAVDDLVDNADEFRTTGPEVQQAFWDGFESTVDEG
jgi:hypothetical protein